MCQALETLFGEMSDFGPDMSGLSAPVKSPCHFLSKIIGI